ncbi:MAG: ATP-binding protein, partial [Candidatus Enteromonas sp.]
GRIGSSLVSLSDFPSLRAKVWEKILFSVSELSVALPAQSAQEVLEVLDAPAFFAALSYRYPESADSVMSRFLGEGFLLPRPDGQYDITMLGALCIAKSFTAFPKLYGKGIEIVTYETDSRISSTGIPKKLERGFLLTFGEAVKAIESAIGTKEEIQGPYRVQVQPIPSIAIREMLSNAVLHQDIGSPAPILVEAFPSRLEILNEGKLEVAPDRVIDMAPRYENRRFAEILSRFGIGEGHGTGFDKIVTVIEASRLPPVVVKPEDHGVRVIAYKEKPWSLWEKSEKRKAIYDHVCLRYVNGEKATNESIRERFGLPQSSKAMASRLIKECMDAGLIKSADPDAGPRSVHYFPYWA